MNMNINKIEKSVCVCVFVCICELNFQRITTTTYLIHTSEMKLERKNRKLDRNLICQH